jgi:IS1 family transposase
MKNLLNEVKAMNKIAGTQMTVEQEVAIIRERLEQLNEATEAYSKAEEYISLFNPDDEKMGMS